MHMGYRYHSRIEARGRGAHEDEDERLYISYAYYCDCETCMQIRANIITKQLQLQLQEPIYEKHETIIRVGGEECDCESVTCY